MATAFGLGVLTLVGAQRPGADGSARTFYQRTDMGGMGGGIVGDVEGPDAPPRALPRMLQPPLTSDSPATAPPYPFFPHAGTLWQDLFVSNFFDLGNGITPRDYECSGYSYVGHTGHDAVIVGFREQAIGVPIFAALDGTVVSAHDGEFDEQVTNLVGRPANFVILSHTGGYRTWYFHFKRGSVAVSVGQTVSAGTQLGLTGSSGNSSWPHLHFESSLNGVSFEPNAGACRSGSTYWANQTTIRRDQYVDSFTFGTSEFSGSAGLPYDQVTRRGSYVIGTQTLYFRFSLHNLPAQSSYRIVILRPDGTTANDSPGSFGNSTLGRHSWYWFYWNVPVTTTGTWTLDLYANGIKIISAPYSSVASAGEIVNHAPLAVGSVAIDPTTPAASDVPFCRVTPPSLYRRDPDYDLVRYRFRWDVNGAVVRDVTNAALSDAIPKGTIRGGDTLTCTVTPTDEATTGASATASAVASGTGLPSPPTNLTATSSGSSVTLTWTAPAGAITTYVIEAGSASGVSDLASFSTDTTATTFFTTGVAAGTYYVRVRAGSAAGTGAASNEATLVVGGSGCAAAPAAPAGLSVLSNSGGTVVLSWSAASGNPTTYVIEAGSGAGAADLANIDLGSAATSFTATSVPRGSYYVRVRGRNLCGNGVVSNEVVVTVP